MKDWPAERTLSAGTSATLPAICSICCSKPARNASRPVCFGGDNPVARAEWQDHVSRPLAAPPVPRA